MLASKGQGERGVPKLEESNAAQQRGIKLPTVPGRKELQTGLTPTLSRLVASGSRQQQAAPELDYGADVRSPCPPSCN
jgi:hypothetical protein